MKNIFVMGSINMDFVVSVDRLPMLGESMRGRGFTSNQGGKGANQALACKKLGGENVCFIGTVGDDDNGHKLLKSLKDNNLNTDGVIVKQNLESGTCIIILDIVKKDNYLICNPGANLYADYNQFNKFMSDRAERGDIFITQFETNKKAVEMCLKKAKECGMYTILNPAPAEKIPREIIKNVDLLIMNETETELITGIKCTDEKSFEKVYDYFSYSKAEVIVTLGSKGSCYLNGKLTYCPAEKVKTVDTTSAGDTFIGALALRKAEGYEICDSLKFASKCSAITVSRLGASVSIPSKQEVEQFC